MSTITTRLLCLTLFLALAGFACTRPKQPPMPMGNLAIGTAYFTQPQNADDMLAGYMPEDAPRIDEKVFPQLDARFNSVLASNSKNTFITVDKAFACGRKVQNESTSEQAALRGWAAVGRCMGADVLVVPQIYVWQERDGGNYGVVTPARVVMDIFVLDTRAESLISRSHFDETQSSLSENLLDADKFVKRGGKWVQAGDLAQEGMEKAVRELGL